VSIRRRLTINWAVVEQRRIAAGLSQHQLIDRIGSAAPTGPRRLWHDEDHDGVPLGVLERLCDVLDLHPTELFTSPPRHVTNRVAGHVSTGHCCIKAKGVLAMQQSGEAGPSGTLENRDKPDI
jgi:DNA-binding Xre family transcriptional regulator